VLSAVNGPPPIASQIRFSWASPKNFLYVR
jgi:hypothetical protein